MDGISVVVCCYNSENRLPKVIEHLACQLAHFDWEIIIVNNNSSDDTVSVAGKELERYHFPGVIFRIIDEPSPGLINARKAGVDNSRHDLIVFCDDDNWLDPDYLQNVYNIFKDNDNVGYAGGASNPVFDPGTTLPAWFKDCPHGYALGKQFDTEGIQDGRCIWGAGMAVRRAAIRTVLNPAFPLLLSGRTGKIMLSGEDSEICMRLNLLGYRLYYSERLHLYHYVSASKLTPSYKDRLYQGFKEAKLILDSYEAAALCLSIGGLQKAVFILKELFRFVFPYYANRRVQASRFLYFFSGVRLFGNQHDHFVGRYLKHHLPIHKTGL